MSSDREQKDQEETNKMPVDNPDLENTEKEEEKTLTDHLNKKLLESFLARIDAGTTGFPNLPQAQTNGKELEEQDKKEFD